MEELFLRCPGRQNVSMDTDSPRAHTGYSDPAGVSTEVRDILLHPAQRQELVLQPLVARYFCARQGEEPQGSQSVVDGDNNQPGLH